MIHSISHRPMCVLIGQQPDARTSESSTVRCSFGGASNSAGLSTFAAVATLRGAEGEPCSLASASLAACMQQSKLQPLGRCVARIQLRDQVEVAGEGVRGDRHRIACPALALRRPLVSGKRGSWCRAILSGLLLWLLGRSLLLVRWGFAGRACGTLLGCHPETQWLVDEWRIMRSMPTDMQTVRMQPRKTIPL